MLSCRFVWAMFMRWTNSEYPIALVPAEDWGKCSLCSQYCRASAASTHLSSAEAKQAAAGVAVPIPSSMGKPKHKAEGEQRGSTKRRDVAGGSEIAQDKLVDAAAASRAVSEAATRDGLGSAAEKADLASQGQLQPESLIERRQEGTQPTSVPTARETAQGGEQPLPVSNILADVDEHSRQLQAVSEHERPPPKPAAERWASPFLHGRGSSWHSWDSALLLFLFCKINYLIVILGGVTVYARTGCLATSAAAALCMAFVICLHCALGSSVFESLLCRPWIWLIMT